MNKYCLLSTDNNPDYYSLLPLVCRSWQRIGYTPKVISVNLPENILQLLSTYCPDVYFIPQESVEGVKDSTIAQLLRLWPLMPNSDDVIVTADADMVIARDIFAHDVSQGQIVSYGFDLTGRSELPICYVKATAAKWRELMGEFTIPDKSYSDKWEDYWSVDQQLLTQRAHAYGMYKITFVDRLHNHPRGLPTGRWDRACWDVIPNEVIDVHMKRNDFDAQLQVFKHLWPNDDYSFLIDFNNAIRSINIPR
jgi:hypothetical protein